MLVCIFYFDFLYYFVTLYFCFLGFLALGCWYS